MSRTKLIQIFVVMLIGLCFTATTLFYNRTSPSVDCIDSALNEAKKGLPLPFILVKPSQSLCQSVEPVTVLVKGNAYHEQYPWNVLLDIVFWSGLTAAAAVTIKKLRY